MRSCGLILPATGPDPSRLFASPRPTAFRPCYPTRVRFGPIRAAAASGSRTEEKEVLGAAAATFYDLLGIPETGSLPEIKQAYKQLALRYHPDVSPPGRAEEYTRRFIRVQEAYETLADPRRRALYDRDMAKGLHLAFSARKSYNFDEDVEDKAEWKSRWQCQLSELKRRSGGHKSSRGSNMSWGARMRRQRDESLEDS